jgi:hypothetical protein
VATETGPDLTFARETVNLLLDDRCVVVRPAVLDVDGLAAAPQVLPPAEAEEPDIPCAVTMVIDGRELTPDTDYSYTHKGLFRAEVVELREGDVVLVKSSRRDPTLLDTPYIVRRIKRSSFAVLRVAWLERFVAARSAHHDWPEEVTP